MRVGRPLAWFLILSVLFTGGLLRRFHERTPDSPFVPTAMGSLLFAGIFLLLLVSAREWRLGASPGPGIRIGSLTPLLLMILIEKWVSISFYAPAFYAITSPETPEPLADATFRAYAGVGLLLLCALFMGFSRPATRFVLARSGVHGWWRAAVATVGVAVGTYAVLGALVAARGADLSLTMPEIDTVVAWVVGGQFVLAFAEEVYYRGLILSELLRLAPRLGLGPAPLRRWFALLASAFLFGMEHVVLGPPWPEVGRQVLFVVALGVLFGLLVLIGSNLHFAAGIHAWINWLVLGVAPRFVSPDGNPALPPGVYVGLALLLAFAASAWLARGASRDARRGARPRAAGLSA